MPSHFLAVRFPLGVLWEDDVSSDTVCLDTYPPGTYEEQPHVFYETDSESVATELVRLFRSIEPPSGLGLEPLAESPPIFDVVSTAGLDLAQRVLLQEDLRNNLDRIEQVVSMSKDDWDPVGLADERLPHDRRTFILAIYNKQAREWEPFVRDELGGGKKSEKNSGQRTIEVPLHEIAARAAKARLASLEQVPLSVPTGQNGAPPSAPREQLVESARANLSDRDPH